MRSLIIKIKVSDYGVIADRNVTNLAFILIIDFNIEITKTKTRF